MKFNIVCPTQAYKQTSLYPPVGLGILNAILYENGFQPEVIDLTFDPKLNQIKKLKKEENAVYAFSVSTAQFNFTKKVISMIKGKNVHSTIILGGAHPTLFPEDCLKEKDIDVVVIGEGDYTFKELIKVLSEARSLESVKGIGFKKGKEIIINERRPFIENLDEIPFPRYEGFPLEEYFKSKGYREMPIIASRGCSGNCTFCQPMLRKIFGSKVRYRSAENVVNEMESLMKKYKLDMLVFTDDTLSSSKEHLLGICNKIIRRKSPVIWRGMLRTNIDEEIIFALKKSGCFLGSFGVESGSQKILNNVKKGIKIEQVYKNLETCKKLGFLIHAFLMVGNKGETWETIKETLNLIEKIKPFSTNVFITTPYPGTDLYYEAKAEGTLYDENFDNASILTSKGFKIDTMRRDEILKAKREVEALFKEKSETYKDIFKLLFRNPPFIVNLFRVVLYNPSFVIRMLNFSFKALRYKGFEMINPHLRKFEKNRRKK